MALRKARHSFHQNRLAIFVDGDFWPGGNSPNGLKLVPYRYGKISDNIARDRRHIARLRQQGLSVVRVWEHDLKRDFQHCIERIKVKIAELRQD